MQTALDCIACFMRQALMASRFVTDDVKVHEQVMRAVLQEAVHLERMPTPPMMGSFIHRVVRETTGHDDPYATVKRLSNEAALAIYPKLAAEIRESDDPWAAGLRLALAGNVIDFAQLEEAGHDLMRDIHREARKMELDGRDVDLLREAVDRAHSILYLADNAGEIVMDRLFIEQMPREKITLAVRGRPIINDATRADAEAVGLAEQVEVIDNGADAPGTILDWCSESFRRRFMAADLVIAKGQGNYETLSDVQREVFFLLMVKCPVIGRDINEPVGRYICRQKVSMSAQS